LTEATIVVATSGAYIDSHPDEVKAFLEAQKEVLDRIEAEEASAMEITAEETGLTVEAVKEMYPMYDFDMTIRDSDIDAMKKTVTFMKDNGMIENNVEIESLIWKAE
ncbi:MAG: ABC transporter substrate-binding protein, partial [Lachnospiraceae bacterium]|nr:ABC transporter substrate-binding protein [Lachnospiraceae bacterium]